MSEMPVLGGKFFVCTGKVGTKGGGPENDHLYGGGSPKKPNWITDAPSYASFTGHGPHPGRERPDASPVFHLTCFIPRFCLFLPFFFAKNLFF